MKQETINQFHEHLKKQGLENTTITSQCLLIKPQTLDFTDFCPIFWYNDSKDFDENKSFFLQFFTDFEHTRD